MGSILQLATSQKKKISVLFISLCLMFSCTMYIVEVTGVDRSVDESETTPVSSSTRLFQNLVSFCAFHVVYYVSQLYVVITNNAFHWD